MEKLGNVQSGSEYNSADCIKPYEKLIDSCLKHVGEF
jgi:hypothetical protein